MSLKTKLKRMLLAVGDEGSMFTAEEIEVVTDKGEKIQVPKGSYVIFYNTGSPMNGTITRQWNWAGFFLDYQEIQKTGEAKNIRRGKKRSERDSYVICTGRSLQITPAFESDTDTCIVKLRTRANASHCPAVVADVVTSH